MNEQEIINKAADNCNEQETAEKRHYKAVINGDADEAANILMSHIMERRPIHQNPQTYEDLQKPILE